MEIGRTHQSLDHSDPHVVSDSVAHARESDGNAAVLQLFDET